MSPDQPCYHPRCLAVASAKTPTALYLPTHLPASPRPECTRLTHPATFPLRDAKARPTCAELLAHPWIRMHMPTAPPKVEEPRDSELVATTSAINEALGKTPALEKATTGGEEVRGGRRAGLQLPACTLHAPAYRYWEPWFVRLRSWTSFLAIAADAEDGGSQEPRNRRGGCGAGAGVGAVSDIHAERGGRRVAGGSGQGGAVAGRREGSVREGERGSGHFAGGDLCAAGQALDFLPAPDERDVVAGGDVGSGGRARQGGFLRAQAGLASQPGLERRGGARDDQERRGSWNQVIWNAI